MPRKCLNLRPKFKNSYFLAIIQLNCLKVYLVRRGKVPDVYHKKALLISYKTNSSVFNDFQKQFFWDRKYTDFRKIALFQLMIFLIFR